VKQSLQTDNCFYALIIKVFLSELDNRVSCFFLQDSVLCLVIVRYD
jgi:hypothetical protein